MIGGAARRDHCGFAVKRLDAVAGCLTELFGYRPRFRGLPADPTIVERITGVAGATAEVMLLDGPADTIELLCFGDPQGSAALRPCDPGYGHVAFLVNDIATWGAALERFGFVRLGALAQVQAGPLTGRRAGYFHHADGFTIELLSDTERPNGAALTEPAAPG